MSARFVALQPGMRQMVMGSALLFVIFLVAWQWAPGLFGIPAFIIPPASLVWEEFLNMLARDRLVYHTSITAMQVGVGFVLGVLLGILCGFALGMSPAAEFVLSPYILALQIAPKVAFAPLFILWMGFTVHPKILVAILIVFYAATFPMALSAWSGTWRSPRWRRWRAPSPRSRAAWGR